MRHSCRPIVIPTPAGRRAAFTLLELVVVLALMGLALAVIAPSFVLRPPSAEEAVTRVVSSARRVAMQRAQTVSFDMNESGEWRVRGTAGRDADTLLSGTIAGNAAQTLRLRITPLGLCLNEADTADAMGVRFDPLTCAPVAPRESTR